MNRPLDDELDLALTAVIGEMQQAVDQLAQVLDAERVALGEGDSAALDHAGAGKQSLMQQLEQLDAERQQLARQRPAAAASQAPAWNAVLDALRDCQQLNQRNGSTVSQRLAQVRRALAIITGQPGDSGTYGRSGELRASRRSQALAAA